MPGQTATEFIETGRSNHEAVPRMESSDERVRCFPVNHGVDRVSDVGAGPAADPHATVAQGVLTGTTDNGVTVFRGVPFAAAAGGRPSMGAARVRR